MNKTSENRDIEQDAIIEWLKPKKLMPSDELLECPCAKNNIKPITNYDKITSSVERLAEFIVETSEYQLDEDLFTYYNPMLQCSTSNKQEAIKSTIKWLQEECEQ